MLVFDDESGEWHRFTDSQEQCDMVDQYMYKSAKAPEPWGVKFKKLYNNPIPVAITIIPYETGIVFVKRKNDPMAGRYALPGGFVNEREHPLHAAIREVKEETNLDVLSMELLDVFLSEQRNQLVFIYQAGYAAGELKAGDDALECIVKSYDKTFINDLAFESHKYALFKHYLT